MLVKRFEDSNLIINRDHLRMEKIIGQGKLFPFTLSHWKTTMPNEPWHEVSNSLTSVDSDEPVQPPFKLRTSKRCSVSSLTLIEYSSDEQRLLSDCANAQADLSLCWSHIPHCWKSHLLAQIVLKVEEPRSIWIANGCESLRLRNNMFVGSRRLINKPKESLCDFK